MGVVLVVLATFLFWVGWRAHRHSEVDWGRPISNWIDGLLRWFCLGFHRLRYEPLPLPEKGPAIVVANHISGLDPLLLLAASPRPLRFLIAREEYERFGLTWLFRMGKCIPVDRDRRPEKALREAIKALEAGEVIALFPHGTIHLDDAPPKALKKGVARLACRAGAQVYPARIEGVSVPGEVLSAVFSRSRATLKARPAVCCSEVEDETLLLQQIAESIAP